MTDSHRRPAFHGGRGYTLVEILVTLVVIGIALTIIMPNIGSSDGDTLRKNAERLAMALEQAGEEAMLRGEVIGWSLEKTSYSFWRLDTNNEWMKYGGGRFMKNGFLTRGVHAARLTVNKLEAPLGRRLIFSPSGNSNFFELTLELNDVSLVLSSDPLGRVHIGEGSKT